MLRAVCAVGAVVAAALQGYNAAIIAYGQTGTGKTYTMEGELEGQLRGIIPRSVEDIFAAIENDPEPSATKYLVRASYLQIYNEVRTWQPAATHGSNCSRGKNGISLSRSSAHAGDNGSQLEQRGNDCNNSGSCAYPQHPQF
eukprot:GHRQ01038549.1.p1 GENE.GHRQ01038549.1~~GHRQ01038549.1.p1  ORF type:complete len:142 (+),score=54.35 GHRQ01038549.1:593-1018(+)